MLRRLATSFDSLRYRQCNTMGVFFLPSVFPGLSFSGFFIVKISSDNDKFFKETRKPQAFQERKNTFFLLYCNESRLVAIQ